MHHAHEQNAAVSGRAANDPTQQPVRFMVDLFRHTIAGFTQTKDRTSVQDECHTRMLHMLHVLYPGIKYH